MISCEHVIAIYMSLFIYFCIYIDEQLVYVSAQVKYFMKGSSKLYV